MPYHICRKISDNRKKYKNSQKALDITGEYLYNGFCVVNESLSGCGSVWLEYLVWDQGVAGSNPVTPISAGVVQW